MSCQNAGVVGLDCFFFLYNAFWREIGGGGALPADILHGQACVIDAQVEERFDTASERFAKLICVLLAQKRPAADLPRCCGDEEVRVWTEENAGGSRGQAENQVWWGGMTSGAEATAGG